LCRGAVIADGSVVALRAVVTKAFTEPNCSIGGIPAKLISTGIMWKRR